MAFTKEELDLLWDKLHDEYEEFYVRFPDKTPEEITDRLFFMKYERDGKTMLDLTNDDRLALLNEFRGTYVWKEHVDFIYERRKWDRIGGRIKDKT